METARELKCRHCGLDCPNDSISLGDDYFCCNGCQTVFKLLNENELSTYYDMEMEPSQRRKGKSDKSNKYEFLDDSDLQNEILSHRIGSNAKLIVELPDIHCSACLYLLENIHKLEDAVLESRVNFIQKKAFINFDIEKLSLRKLCELLDKIGYPPNLSLANTTQDTKKESDRKLYFKLGAAFFAFGNIMLFAFPEYLGGADLESDFRIFLSKLSLVLTPVILYAGWDYFKSAHSAIRAKHINIDVPIALGMIVLVLRSAYEILSQTGVGYLDSLSGLVFFLLIGKIFQKKTYDRLSFDRELSNYFPLSVLKKGEPDKYIPLMKLEIGDRIIVKYDEIIPTDSILMSESAKIDYSFVTGESDPVTIQKGEKIWAGGRNKGKNIEMDSIKKFDKSSFIDIWNRDEFQKQNQNTYANLADRMAKYFTFIIIGIASLSFIYWYKIDHRTAFDALTAVLIIACPCALALSTPFTYGTVARILSRKGLFLKDTAIIESLSNIKNIVFDKTGTLTYSSKSEISFSNELKGYNKSLIKSATKNSNHPISKMIFDSLDGEVLVLDNYEEIPGKGISAKINNDFIKIGSKNWINPAQENQFETNTYVLINSDVIGYFTINQKLREGIKESFGQLSGYEISLISGDNEKEKSYFSKFLPNTSELKFNCLPEEKFTYVKAKKESGPTMMVGDGLNDAGALKAASIGLAVTEESSSFTPGSDAIILGDSLKDLYKILSYSKSSVNTVIISFIISFLYNIVGLAFAVSGNLSPITAAILMPLSSITVVLFTTLTSIAKGKHHFKQS